MSGSEIVKRVGQALYGERWQAPLSRDLEITDRTLRNWRSGRYDPPPELTGQLLGLLRRRGKSVADLTLALETMPKPPDADALPPEDARAAG